MKDERLLTLDEIAQLLKDRTLSVISKRIGISRVTLCKFRNRSCDSFHLDTVKRISDYLRKSVE